MQNDVARTYCFLIPHPDLQQKLYDLLQDSEANKPLTIREDKYSRIFVEGLSEYVITNPDDCLYLLRRGEHNRITRQTKSNLASSRSHSLFQLVVKRVNPGNNGKLIRAKLNLCDLVDSEKINTKNEANYRGYKRAQDYQPVSFYSWQGSCCFV